MNSIWILLVITVAAMIIGSLLKGQRQPKRNAPKQQRNVYDMPAQQNVPVARERTPRRRVQPPPIPRARIVEVEEVLPVARAAPPTQTEMAKPPKAAIVERKQQTKSGVQVGDMLRDRQSLTAAILLYEVIGPPVCRRRRPVGYSPGTRTS